MTKAEVRYHRLLDSLRDLGKVAVAFSGGVDSTFLLYSARKALDDNVIAFTVKTPYIPDWEVEEAIAFCRKEGIRHRIVQTQIIEEILKNPVNRCYLCKRHLFATLKSEAEKEGFKQLLDGTNADDTGDYRPGLTALTELDVRSPLLQNNLTKEDIRFLSRSFGLPTADKPSYACLLTRLPYGHKVDLAELNRIELAEVYLGSLGYRASRVRSHGQTARIELEKDRIQMFVEEETMDEIVAYFNAIGFAYVTLDLEGYRMGSYNETLKTGSDET